MQLCVKSGPLRFVLLNICLGEGMCETDAGLISRITLCAGLIGTGDARLVRSGHTMIIEGIEQSPQASTGVAE
jgi:hypothetical protein